MVDGSLPRGNAAVVLNRCVPGSPDPPQKSGLLLCRAVRRRLQLSEHRLGVIGIAFITFDLDGTLVDSPFERIVLPRVWQKLEAYGVREPREALIREQLKRFAQDRRVDAFHWDDLVMTIAREQGVDWTDRLEDLVRGELGERISQETFFDDVPQALDLLRARGYQCGVISNGYVRYQKALFDRMSLTRYFDAFLGPDVLGIAKPDPQVFAHEALRSGVAMHVGDLLTQDVTVAKRAGILAVMVARPKQVTADFARLAEYAPRVRPHVALREGWLLSQYEKEHRYLRRNIPPEPLNSASDAFPDAIVLSFSELENLLEDGAPRSEG